MFAQPKLETMKKEIYLLLSMLIFVACSSSTEEYAEEESTVIAEEMTYNYSGSFEMTDNSSLEVTNAWLEAVINKDTEAAANLLADSVSIYLWDGATFVADRDSIMQLFQGFVDSFTDIQITKLAGVAVHSSDRNHDWGMVWVNEKVNRPDGTSETMVFQENFQIENGKIRSVRQYAQKPSESIDPDGGVSATEDEPEYAYSGSFVMHDASMTNIVTGWNNAIVASDFDKAATYLADSVDIYFWDGMYLNASKDSVMAFAREVVGSFTSIEVSFDAAIPVRSTDQNETWVLSWTDEKWTDADGKVEHMSMHEDYLIVDDKIRTVRQYAMMNPAGEE